MSDTSDSLSMSPELPTSPTAGSTCPFNENEPEKERTVRPR